MKFIEGLTSKGGHYSPGVIAGGMLYISGQLPIDPLSGKIAEGGIREQTRQALANVGRVLSAAGLGPENAVMCRVYISDMGNWDAVNEVYADFFGAHKPARAVVPTRELHHGALVEIEATAEMKE